MTERVLSDNAAGLANTEDIPMTTDLRSALSRVLPKAITWAEDQYALIAQSGHPLTDLQLAVAKNVGVVHPERIRVAEVSCLPQPEDPELRDVALATELFGTCLAGMTIGYGIYVCQGYASFDFLSHEFRHVQQYEKAGSIAAFLPRDVAQIVDSLRYHEPSPGIDARSPMPH